MLPSRPKPRHPRDGNQLAFQVVQESVAETTPSAARLLRYPIEEELHAYLAHRLRLAGCELPLFDPPAVEALAHSARGLPRLINRIAHYALTAAVAKGERTVTVVHLEHAVAELRL